MKSKKWLPVCIVLFVLCVIPQIAAAAGSLESIGDGLWSYYQGRSMSWVRSHAPKFAKLSTERSLLDEAEMQGVELYLVGDFKDDKLVLLQILTPYPDYSRCTDDVKDLTYSFAIVGSVMMGIDFEPQEDCTLDNGTFICIKGKDLCTFELCPEEWGYFGCSSLDFLNN